MFITPAFAQICQMITPAFAAARRQSGTISRPLLPFVLIFVIMYFLILRPQQSG